MKTQLRLRPDGDYADLDRYLKETGVSKLLLVCGSSLSRLALGRYFETLEERIGIRCVRFSNFQPNPKYESVSEGVRLFRREGCGAVFAAGGGSAIDVAKCIKLYASTPEADGFLRQRPWPNSIPLLAAPTTAGSGSEATRYAVIYEGGEKRGVTDDACIPDAVLLDGSVLRTLPERIQKASMLDALCHGVESFWSIHSNRESKRLSAAALRKILENRAGYLRRRASACQGMLEAAHLAGQAINITQTTAGHAMSYQLTALCGLEHGYAVALCTAALWPYMLSHLERCADPRGARYVESTLEELAHIMGCSSAREGAAFFQELAAQPELPVPTVRARDFPLLVQRVNPERLKNHPIYLDQESIALLYHQIVREQGGPER